MKTTKRLMSIILSLIMLLSITAGLDFSAYAASPKQVTNLSYSNLTTSSVKLKWKKVSNVTGYYVYKYTKSNNKYTKIATAKSTNYTVKKLKSNTTYRYTVKAYKKKGKKVTTGKMSKKLTVTTKKKTEKIIKLNTRKITSKYDITGDKKADKIQFVCENSKGYGYYGDDYYDTLKVYINDNLAYKKTTNGAFEVTSDYTDIYSKLIKLRNGKTFLSIGIGTVNEDFYVYGIYQYNNGKLKNVLDLNKTMAKYTYHNHPAITKVDGNTISVSYGGMFCSFAGTEFTFKYTYSGGKFKMKKDGTVGYVGVYTNNYDYKKTKTLTTAKKISVYKSTSAKKANASIPKNKKVKLTGCRYIDGKLFVKMTYNKKTYWYKAKTDGYGPFKNLAYGG